MRVVAAALFALILSGCGGYIRQTSDIRKAYEVGENIRALELFEKQKKDLRDKDKLLALLDEGMLLHSAGKYDESIKVLAEADRLSSTLETVSVTEEAGTFLSNEGERAYKGEDFEKLMISVLQALNYSGLGKDEDALVEVRRVNERVRKLISDEKKPYEQLAVAKYLAGALWEDQGELDSAFIDYYDAYKLQPALGPLASALLRTAKLTGRDSQYNEIKAAFPEASDAPLGPNEGEVLVVVEAGLSPEKYSSQERRDARFDNQGRRLAGPEVFDVPVYRDRWSHRGTTVKLGGAAQDAVVVTSLSNVAKVHLQDRVGRMLLKQLGATAVKAGIAVGVGAVTKSEELGILTFILLSLFNQADTRSWLSLPAEFQLARFKAPAGKQTVEVAHNASTSTHEVTVRPKRLSIVTVRRY